MNKLATFYIVRHGQTAWNVAEIMQGTSDSSLTDEDIESAKKLGKNFKEIKFDLVYSSDLMRAKRTAEIILLERKLAIQTTKLLRERAYGEFEGKHNQEYKIVNETLNKLTDEERYSFKYSKEIERDKEIVERFLTFIREVAIVNPGKTILVVSHGGIMRSVLVKLGFGNYIELRTGSVKNMGWFKLETDGVDFFIRVTKNIRRLN